jgi:hypothetical protein
MSKLGDDLHGLGEDLGRSRDALRVEMALAKDEIREEWEELEQKWDHFNKQLKSAGHEAALASEDISTALAKLGEELHQGYERIRKSLRR